MKPSPDKVRESWTLRFTDRGRDGCSPFAVRVRLLIKHAARYLGLSAEHVPDPKPLGAGDDPPAPPEVRAPAPPDPSQQV